MVCPHGQGGGVEPVRTRVGKITLFSFNYNYNYSPQFSITIIWFNVIAIQLQWDG